MGVEDFRGLKPTIVNHTERLPVSEDTLKALEEAKTDFPASTLVQALEGVLSSEDLTLLDAACNMAGTDLRGFGIYEAYADAEEDVAAIRGLITQLADTDDPAQKKALAKKIAQKIAE